MSDLGHPLDERVTPAMLAIVDPDPVVAAARFQKLLADLTRSLEWWGCRDPEGVAAESVYRALRKLSEGTDVSASGLRAYIFGVAKLVAKEGWKFDRREQQWEANIWEVRESPGRHQERTEARVMLEQVQRLLGKDQWKMLLRYCTEDDHTVHSRELDVSPGYLRVMIHRLREELRAKALPERARDLPGRIAPKRSPSGAATAE